MKSAFSVLLFLGILATSQATLACQCTPSPMNLCESIIHNEHIALVKVISHDGEFIDVVVLDEIRNTFSTDTITVIGQDGFNCAENLYLFDVNDTLVLGLKEWETEDEMYLSMCGLYYLFYSNGQVLGDINPFLSSQSYDDFISNFSNCTYVTVPENDDEPVVEFQNDGKTMVVSTANQRIKSIRVFNTIGAMVYTHENASGNSVHVDVGALKPSIYLFEVVTTSGRSVKKLFLQ